MNKKTIFLLFFLLLIVPVVFAQNNWVHEANSGLRLPGSQGFVAFGSNQNNILTNISYTMCNMEGSLFTPVSADFDGDNSTDIITINTNSMRIYNQDCALLYEQTLHDTPRAMPVIVNYNTNGFQEVVLLMGSVLEAWEFDGNESLTIAWSANYTTGLAVSDLDHFDCTRQFWVSPNTSGCVMMDQGSRNVYVYYHSNTSFITRANEIPNTALNKNFDNGFSGSFPGTTYLLPVCLGTLTNSELICYRLEDDGNYNGITTNNVVSASTAIGSIEYNSIFIAKLGNVFRWFINVEYTKTFGQHSYKVYDTLGNFVFNGTHSAVAFDFNESSNWMIADYKKQGFSMACIVQYDNNINNTFLRCYDASFNSAIVEENLTGFAPFDTPAGITKSMVLADFDPSKATLGIGTQQGIFYADGTAIFTSNTTIDTNRSGIIISNPKSGSPALIYGSDTITYMIRNPLVSTNCGNRICEDFESAFSCPVDCGVKAGVQCIVDSDCSSSFPNCLANTCVRGLNVSLTCNLDTDCPPMSPICFSNFCVQSISNLSQNNNGTADGQNGIDKDTIDQVFNLLLMGSSLLKFIAGIVIIIAFLLIAGDYYSKAGKQAPAIILIIVTFLGLVMVTLLGLIPVFVLILVILFLLLITVWAKVMTPSGD